MSPFWKPVAALLCAAAISASAQTEAPLPDVLASPPPPPTTPCKVDTFAPDPHKPNAQFPSFLNDNFIQLKNEVPALHGIRFEESSGSGPGNADAILEKLGELLTAMAPKVPNLVAKEELSQVLVAVPYFVTEGYQNGSAPGIATRRNSSMPAPTYTEDKKELRGEELSKALETMLGSPKNRTVFSYRIHATPDPTYGTVLEEFRTNDHDQPVGVADLNPGNPQGVGFSGSWLMFMPGNLKEAHFRYIGKQKLGKHETFVIAFAQVPDQVNLPAQLTSEGRACSYFTQGIVWIDQTVYNIVSLETDLLSPIANLHMQELRSTVHFTDVHIPERNLVLWMPSDVEITWKTSEQAYAEMHRYSNYRLFTATSRIIIPD